MFGILALLGCCAAQGGLLSTFRDYVTLPSSKMKMLVRCRVVGVSENSKLCVLKEMDIRQQTKREEEAGTRL